MYSPTYTISNTILKNIGIIEGCKEVIDTAPMLPAWEKKFQEDAVVRQVHHGTHLEGNELNLNEAAQVVAGNEIIGRPRDIQEVLNYREVIDHIGRLAEKKADKTNEPESLHYNISADLLLKLHKLTTNSLLSDEKRGVFRKTGVVIKDSQTGAVTFRPPPAVEVPFLVDLLLSWINDQEKNVHPVLIAGIVHYELNRIHPFVDGNGRVARALATYILYIAGYDIRRFFSLEEYYDRNSGEYYSALQSVSKQNGDLTIWLEYFTRGLAIELTRIKDKIKKLSTDVHIKDRLGGQQIFLSERQIKMIEYIQQAGYLQNQMFPQLFPMVSEDTVLRDLKDLLDKGIIIKTGKTKGARYTIKP
jgi:Fic family protein